MQNGLVESFDGRMREECLNEHLFPSLRHACRMNAIITGPIPASLV
tara:strand:- start:387 stop:524 length:138 start_codon:yes stop_codon:yes gene_type:complete